MLPPTFTVIVAPYTDDIDLEARIKSSVEHLAGHRGELRTDDIAHDELNLSKVVNSCCRAIATSSSYSVIIDRVREEVKRRGASDSSRQDTHGEEVVVHPQYPILPPPTYIQTPTDHVDMSMRDRVVTRKA